MGFHVDRTEVGDMPRPRTEIMLNLGNPDLAFKTSFLPNDGVGDSLRVQQRQRVHLDVLADDELHARESDA
ncbi:hypothetical protein C6A85_02960, partial [Mycobacterium sp. ITM-2017-0098]